LGSSFVREIESRTILDYLREDCVERAGEARADGAEHLLEGVHVAAARDLALHAIHLVCKGFRVRGLRVRVKG